MKIAVSSDSTCAIKQEEAKSLGIYILPLNVIVDGKEYHDDVTINQNQLRDMMRGGSKIQTSTPTPYEIESYFDNIFAQGYEKIIHFTISSKLSSMYSLFKNIAEENYEGKLTVIDSYAITSAMLSYALYAYDEVQKGTSIEVICENIEELKKEFSLTFIPENLNALKNGGRISPAIASIANTIGIKPLITFVDGGLEKDKMIKNTKHAIMDRFNELLQNHPIEEYDYTLIQCQAKETTYQYLIENIEAKIGQGALIQGTIPINVLAHCGPGTIGLIMTKKINKKSLKSFM